MKRKLRYENSAVAEKKHLRTLAKKIKKVPKEINIPGEYLA